MSANNRLSSQFYSSFPGNGWAKGIVFTFFIALLGYVLALVPGFNFIGQLACAIIIAVAYRQLFGYPESLRSGIAFSSKRLLRAAIILYGLKLNVHVILEDGIGLLARDTAVVLLAILGTLFLARVFKADRNISLLLGVGTGICGAAAIAAVAPIIKAKDEDTAIGVGIIALMGTVFAITYTVLRPFLPIGDIEYGMWVGMSLHEVAHVALAGAPAGEAGLAMALLAKLGRVFLLIPVCFIFIWIMKRKSPAGDVSSKVEFPWFLLGFMGMSLFGSYVLGPIIPLSDGTMDVISLITTWLLTAAMVGLGLNVSLKDVKERALMPLAVMTIVSFFISTITFFTL